MESGTVLQQKRVGIVSSEPIRLAGLLSVLEVHPTAMPVAGDLDTMLRDGELHFLILDLTEHAQWLETLTMVRRTRPDVRLLMMGEDGDDERILRAIAAGARAYLDHNASALAVRQALNVVMQGFIWAPRRLLSTLIDRLLAAPAASRVVSSELSRREKQVRDLIMKVYSNREIALELGIEERTVKAYLASLMQKSGVTNRVALSMQRLHDIRGDRGPLAD